MKRPEDYLSPELLQNLDAFEARIVELERKLSVSVATPDYTMAEAWTEQLRPFRVVGPLRLPLEHAWSFYDITTSPPSHRPVSVDQVIQVVSQSGGHPDAVKLYTDVTLGLSLAVWRAGAYQLNPIFLDPWPYEAPPEGARSPWGDVR